MVAQCPREPDLRGNLAPALQATVPASPSVTVSPPPSLSPRLHHTPECLGLSGSPLSQSYFLIFWCKICAFQSFPFSINGFAVKGRIFIFIQSANTCRGSHVPHTRRRSRAPEGTRNAFHFLYGAAGVAAAGGWVGGTRRPSSARLESVISSSAKSPGSPAAAPCQHPHGSPAAQPHLPWETVTGQGWPGQGPGREADRCVHLWPHSPCPLLSVSWGSVTEAGS